MLRIFTLFNREEVVKFLRFSLLCSVFSITVEIVETCNFPMLTAIFVVDVGMS